MTKRDYFLHVLICFKCVIQYDVYVWSLFFLGTGGDRVTVNISGASLSLSVYTLADLKDSCQNGPLVIAQCVHDEMATLSNETLEVQSHSCYRTATRPCSYLIKHTLVILHQSSSSIIMFAKRTCNACF